MKTVLFAAAVLIPSLALADSGKAYVLYNGRSTPPSAPAGRPGFSTPAPFVPAAPAAAPARSAFGAATSRAAYAPSGFTSRRSSSGFWHPLRLTHAVGRGLGARAAADTGGSTGGTSGGATQTPPNYSKPGALIRTEGQLPQYSNAAPARQHAVDGGGFVALDQSKAKDAGRSPGVTWGQPDTLPPATPDSGGAAGGNGVTANGTTSVTVNNTTQNGASGNTNGNRDGNGGNQPPHGTGFDPSF